MIFPGVQRLKSPIDILAQQPQLLHVAQHLPPDVLLIRFRQSLHFFNRFF
jgi:hypothetical protein